MNLQPLSRSHRQVVRLLQICHVLEEMTENRARARAIRSTDLDGDVRAFLEESAGTSVRHRERLGVLLKRLDADPSPCGDVQQFVDEQCASETRVGHLLSDQLHDAEAAFELYDTLLRTVRDFHAVSGLDRQYLRSALTDLRADEANRVRRLTALTDADE